MWYFIIALGLLVVAGWLALQYAIARNGPAVLDTVDRLSGGDRGVALRHRTSFGENAQQKLLVFGEARATGPKPVIIFAHGGSWRSGDPDDYGFVARALAPEGFVVVLAGYRLGEEGKFPAMVEDTASAIVWTRENIATYGGDPDAIFLAGHSAGAYNVIMTTLDRQWLGREGLEDDAVKGVIGLAGPYDFYPFDSDSTIASFGDWPRPDATQPINFVRGDAPPMLLLTGEQDTTVKPRNSRVLARAISDAGGQVETAFFPEHDHISILTAKASPWNRDGRMIEQITSFVADVLKRRGDQSIATSVPVQAKSG